MYTVHGFCVFHLDEKPRRKNLDEKTQKPWTVYIPAFFHLGEKPKNHGQCTYLFENIIFTAVMFSLSSCYLFAVFSSFLGPLGSLSAALAPLSAALGCLGLLLGTLGPLLDRFGPPLGQSWALLGGSWEALGRS